MSTSVSRGLGASPHDTTRALTIGQTYHIDRQDAPARRATILNVRTAKAGQEAYISYENSDKRLDTWIPVCLVGEPVTNDAGPSTPSSANLNTQNHTEGRNASPTAASTPEREHEALTRVRNFEDVRFGEYLIKTWYYSPYPLPAEEKMDPTAVPTSSTKKRKSDASAAAEKIEKAHLHKSRSHGEMFAGVGQGGEGARGRLWVCDYCFKYMKTKDGWYRHKATCNMLTPPGRKVYEKGSYSIWEVDGAQSPLYCQNLSLFGKLFIDHKSLFFHVDNFLFYVICDASTSKHDLAMAFFSKEKLSYDDYNLACIVTFPPCQNRGFGKLLIEFSYYLTKHPSTRPATESPGTPERPLSDLGLKGYTAYWVSALLRVCRELLSDAPESPAEPPQTPVKSGTRPTRAPRASAGIGEVSVVEVNGIDLSRISIPSHKGHYAVQCTLAELAKAAHLRVDDTAYTLAELGFLQHRRSPQDYMRMSRRRGRGTEDEEMKEHDDDDEGELGEWKDVEVVITKSMVDDQWVKWRVKEKGVLDESCVLL